MTETEATIKVLDKIGERVTIRPYSKIQIAWSVEVDSDQPTMFTDVALYKDKFLMGFILTPADHPKYDGFELLEQLAKEYPYVAAKLAEPIK